MLGAELATIVAIDPGNNLGVAVLHVNANTLKVVNVYTRTHVLNRVVGPDDVDGEFKVWRHLTNILESIYYEYRPVAIGMETAFINNKFPKAIMKLTQYTMLIDQTFRTCNPFIKFFKYSPKYVKKFAGAGGDANKDDMFANIKNLTELHPFVDVRTMTEHEIDALSIAYVTLDDIRKDPISLLRC